MIYPVGTLPVGVGDEFEFEAAQAGGLYRDPDTFYTVVVTSSYIALSSLFTDSDSFYAHTASPGPVYLFPQLYQDTDTFYQHSLVQGYSKGIAYEYVTVEFGGERRRTISRDIINHELFKDRIHFTKVSHTDEIRYSTKTDHIFFSLRA